jgi:hypothetical protein
VFGTTNLASDAVGDSLDAIARNRVCLVTVRKPHAGFNADGSIDPDSWGMWAINNDIAPEIIAWVKEHPQALASYTDGDQSGNEYIFNPTKVQSSFVTPRSLEKASKIVKKRSVLGRDTTLTLLAGTIGESAARQMDAFFTVVDKLPSWEAIIKDPKNAKLPGAGDAIASCLVVFGAIARVDDKTLDNWLTYVERMPMEWQALFAKSAMKSATKQPIMVKNARFKQWAMDNQWAF